MASSDARSILPSAFAGISFTICNRSGTYLAEGRLVRPFGDDLAYDFAYYIVHRPQADKAPVFAAFKTWLLEEAGEKS